MGLLTILGCKIHWAQPYHGQSKPIERAFRDLCESIAKHPACAGAYTGSNPTAKPENYASRALPTADFKVLVSQQIALHNAQQGRTGGVCAGRAFDEVFATSYAESPITKATPQQQRSFLLAAQQIRADRSDGSVRILGNRFWHAQLTPHMGKRLTVRFDPDAPRAGVQIETADGRFVCSAPCVAAVGFADQEAATKHARAKGAFEKASKNTLIAARTLTASEASNVLRGGTLEGSSPPHA